MNVVARLNGIAGKMKMDGRGSVESKSQGSGVKKISKDLSSVDGQTIGHKMKIIL